MFASSLLALTAAAAFAGAQVYKGFNYGSVFSDGSAITQADYENEFTTAQQLVGTSGFTSARLFTIIQAGTTDTPTQAIPAAISTKTSLLLGLFLSSDQAVFNNELAALSAAISTYGQDFIDLIAGISVGSEDLYRISPIGIENDSGAGVEPVLVADYIAQVRSLIAGTAASGKLVGHVDTWTAWVNSSNNAVIDASDFIGMDAYPYFQNTMSNGISSGRTLFFDAYNATVAVSGGKPVWITETGWPVSGPTENLAVANVANAATYWDQVGCSVLGNINTWWYILQDAYPTTSSPSFGVVSTTLSTTPLYDLSCGAGSKSVSSSSSSASPSSSASSIATKSTVSSAVVSSAASSFPTSSLVDVPKASKTSEQDMSSMATSRPAPSLATTATYTTVVTSPITHTSGSMTKTSTTASAVILTSTVGNTLSTMVQVPTTISNEVNPGTSQTPKSCPSSLSGEYQYPHLIVAINKNYPDVMQGNSYNARFSPTISSIFNFDVPVSYKDMTCSLVFFFPARESMQTSNYTMSGSGGIDVTQLQNAATVATTYNTVPVVTAEIGGIKDIQAGRSYEIASSACAAGTRVSYEISASGNLDLEYFQDFNPAPIGLYITAC